MLTYGYNLNAGQNIAQTKLDSIPIFTRNQTSADKNKPRNANKMEVIFNLMNVDIVFDNSLSGKINELFFIPLCKNETSPYFPNVILIYCPSSGLETPGMPRIILVNVGG